MMEVYIQEIVLKHHRQSQYLFKIQCYSSLNRTPKWSQELDCEMNGLRILNRFCMTLGTFS